ncbi:DUF1996 domain-containing protein [Streptomyces sp. MS2.AVA.5]|uniref:DUF1996 domain-containing protein n=1 Tax=Streptomyces achmelvichensis TaxID=3134111 RepID=A0ACC6Q1R2_9ACTN
MLRRLLASTAAVIFLITAGWVTAGNHSPASGAADDDGAPGHARAGHTAHDHTFSPAQAAAIVAQAAAPVRGSEFRAECFSSHRRGDDPIVFPGQAGRSHFHEFYGNRTANASSTLQSLAAGTTNCSPSVDLSSYWTPTLYKNGAPVAPERVTVYYQGITDHTRAVAHPAACGTWSATPPPPRPIRTRPHAGRAWAGRSPAGTS